MAHFVLDPLQLGAIDPELAAGRHQSSTMSRWMLNSTRTVQRPQSGHWIGEWPRGESSSWSVEELRGRRSWRELFSSPCGINTSAAARRTGRAPSCSRTTGNRAARTVHGAPLQAGVMVHPRLAAALEQAGRRRCRDGENPPKTGPRRHGPAAGIGHGVRYGPPRQRLQRTVSAKPRVVRQGLSVGKDVGLRELSALGPRWTCPNIALTAQGERRPLLWLTGWPDHVIVANPRRRTLPRLDSEALSLGTTVFLPRNSVSRGRNSPADFVRRAVRVHRHVALGLLRTSAQARCVPSDRKRRPNARTRRIDRHCFCN